MHVTVRSVEQHVLDMRLRMPFHFGSTEVTQLPHIFTTAAVELDGEVHEGVAAEHLSAMWYLKDDDGSYADRLDLLLEPVETATKRAETVEGESVFDYWHRLYEAQREWATETDHVPLVWSFGVGLVERAVIDAFCRATETTFAEAVRENVLGIDLGRIHPELGGDEPADLLPASPLRSTTVRHTVGFTDPLTESNVAPEDRLDDGLPQSLAEYIREQDLTHFKVKMVGDATRDARRLADVAATLDESCEEYVFTLDANEQFDTAESFREQWEALTSNPTLEAFFDRLRYVEQPIARDEALAERAKRTFASWDDRPPIIIDESDGDLDSLRIALDCGYDGTSHKNCKGVFKGLANACLVESRRRSAPDGDEYVLSGEDLSVVGPVGLQQDLAVTSTLGLEHVERNGHHYFRGTTALPDPVRDDLLERHPDLYRRHEEGFVAVDIENGLLETASVVDAPFGYDFEFDATQFVPLEEWTFRSD